MLNHICLCIQESAQSESLSENLRALGYEVRVGRETSGGLEPSAAYIMDRIHIERYRATDILPVLFVVRLTPEWVNFAAANRCSGIIDSTFEGLELKAILEISIQMQKTFNILNKENKKLTTKLQDRRVVEKAKLLLMKRSLISEEMAYQYIRSEAMRRQQTLKEIADMILLNEE